ncbi:MAG: fibronectin type III domain-containing protein, partial [Candidatus Micrarchaeota archaeon]
LTPSISRLIETYSIIKSNFQASPCPTFDYQCAGNALLKWRINVTGYAANQTAFYSAFRRAASQQNSQASSLDLEPGSPFKYFPAGSFSFSTVYAENAYSVFVTTPQFQSQYGLTVTRKDECKARMGIYSLTATTADFGATWRYALKPLSVIGKTFPSSQINPPVASDDCPVVTACNLIDAFYGSQMVYSSELQNKHCLQFEWPVVPDSAPADLRGFAFLGVSPNTLSPSANSFLLSAVQNTSLESASGTYYSPSASDVHTFNPYNIFQYPDVFSSVNSPSCILSATPSDSTGPFTSGIAATFSFLPGTVTSTRIKCNSTDPGEMIPIGVGSTARRTCNYPAVISDQQFTASAAADTATCLATIMDRMATQSSTCTVTASPSSGTGQFSTNIYVEITDLRPDLIDVLIKCNSSDEGQTVLIQELSGNSYVATRTCTYLPQLVQTTHAVTVTSTDYPGLSCSSDVIQYVQTSGDIDPPNTITNLGSFVAATSNSITLSWTAPADDGTTGTGSASSYDFRYLASRTLDASSWDQAVRVEPMDLPLPRGTTQSFTVTGLQPQTAYHFRIKAADEVPNWSALSNEVVATTLSGNSPPAWITITNISMAPKDETEFVELDLWPFVSDTQTPDQNLVFTAISETDPEVISCSMPDNRYLECGPALNVWNSTMSNTFKVKVQARDGGGLSSESQLYVKVGPTLDLPDEGSLSSYIYLLPITFDHTYSYYVDGKGEIQTEFAYSITYQSDYGRYISCMVNPRQFALSCTRVSQESYYSAIAVTLRVSLPDGRWAEDTIQISLW